MADITNITLNGTNYTLRASGGGGEQVVELTQAEYDALTSYTENTTYIITDATPIDMDNYATTGSVANKADKQSVTERGSGDRYWPGWNNQGVITGATQYYTGNTTINGTNYGVVKTSSGNMTGFYAPTSAGTQNTILMSNGSGAPSWSSIKMQFISQSAYDALVTKDASTIYFIISEN